MIVKFLSLHEQNKLKDKYTFYESGTKEHADCKLGPGIKPKLESKYEAVSKHMSK